MQIDKQEIFQLISQTLKVSPDIITEELAMGDIEQWDSLAHVNLLASVEKQFNITLDIDQALEIESVEDVIYTLEEILQTSNT